MTDPQVAILMLGLFILIVLLGFPIAFTLIATLSGRSMVKGITAAA